MRFINFLLIAVFLLSCQTTDKAITNTPFTSSILPPQTFLVNSEKDTVLKTIHGSLIRISAGSFVQKGEVRLEIKEALSPAEIFAAGLSTESNGQPLASGGMIYINTVDKNTALLKPLRVSIPTNSIEPAMQVFKGVETDSGRINWTDPQPLDSTPLQNSIAIGKAIFRAKCIACHNVFTKMTGPA